MKHILNRLINHETISKEEAKNVLVNISNGEYNQSQIASFLTVYMMRSITVNELEGFRDALLDLCLAVDFRSIMLLTFAELEEMEKIHSIFLHCHLLSPLGQELM